MNCLGYALTLGTIAAIIIARYIPPSNHPYMNEICGAAVVLTMTNIYARTYKILLGEHPK